MRIIKIIDEESDCKELSLWNRNCKILISARWPLLQNIECKGRIRIMFSLFIILVLCSNNVLLFGIINI